MVSFFLYTGLSLVCVAFALWIIRTGTITRNDGTIIEPPFKGEPFWAQLLLSLVAIVLLPLILFLMVGEWIRQRLTKPCSLESDRLYTHPTPRPKDVQKQLGKVVLRKVRRSAKHV